MTSILKHISNPNDQVEVSCNAFKNSFELVYEGQPQEEGKVNDIEYKLREAHNN
jgi:hypothetical protein